MSRVESFSYTDKLVFVVPGFLDAVPWNSNALAGTRMQFNECETGGGLIIVDDVGTEELSSMRLFMSRAFWRECEVVSRLSTCGLGNLMAETLGRRVLSLEPPRIPRIAVQYGYPAGTFRRPNCFVTPESIVLEGECPAIAILPKSPRKAFKAFGVMQQTLAGFGMRIEHNLAFPDVALQQLPWLRTIRSNAACVKIVECPTNCTELILGMVIYAAEIVASLHERLLAVYLMAEFEGHPRVREFWTSPPL